MKIVKVSDIKSNPINEQIYDLSGIEELAASIDEVGLLQSITVNQSHTVIVCRQSFWNHWLRKLRESLAHPVALIMQRAGGDASVALRVSFV